MIKKYYFNFIKRLRIIKYTSIKERYKLFNLILLGFISGIFEISSVAILLPLLSTVLGADISELPKFVIDFTNLIGGNSSEIILLRIAILFCFIVLFGALLRFYNLYSIGQTSADIGVSLTDQAYISSLSKPYSYYLENGTSKLVSSFTTKPGEVSVAIQNLLNIFSSIILLISILITLLAINLNVTLITFITLFIAYWSLNTYSSNRLRLNSKLMCFDNDSSVKNVQESFEAIKDIILDNSQEFFRRDYRKLIYSVRKKYAENSFYGNSAKIIIEPLALMTIFFGIFLETKLNGVSIVNAIALFASITFGLQKLLPVMQNIYANYVSLISNYEYVNDVLKIIDNQKRREVNSKLKKLSFNSSIILKNISYRYNEGRDYVFNNLNLKINKNEKIGIIGDSGIGKTTLLDILVGLINPDSGDILIDDEKINKKYPLNKVSNWQKNISIVHQNVALHDISIAENIALGESKEEIDIAYLKKCLDIVELNSLIDSLPKGIWTISGERGNSFSGGQCQRIGIARALYKRKKVLFLDEATNKLDNKTESNLLKNIMNNKNLTVIIVSHKISNLKKCDKIYKISNKDLSIYG